MQKHSNKHCQSELWMLKIQEQPGISCGIHSNILYTVTHSTSRTELTSAGTPIGFLYCTNTFQDEIEQAFWKISPLNNVYRSGSCINWVKMLVVNVWDSAQFKNKRMCPMDAWFIFNLWKKIGLVTGKHTHFYNILHKHNSLIHILFHTDILAQH